MTDFAATWNNQIPATRKASVIAGLTAGAINDYLKAHRVHDSGRYLIQREFKDGTQAKLKLTLIVGGNKGDHNNGRAKPLTVAFPKPGETLITSGYRSMYEFSAEHGSYTVDQLADQLPNLVISARAINLYMEWPNSQGGSWSHHQDGIDFDLEARFDLVEDDGRYSLRFIPVKLHVSQNSEHELRAGIITTIAKIEGSAVPTSTDPKISDLIMAVVELAATAIGPNLTRNIAIPVFEFDKFEASPTALALSDGVVTVAAHLDFGKAVAETAPMIESLRTGLISAFERDLEKAGGALNILFDPNVIRSMNDLPPERQWEYLLAQPTRSDDAIESSMKNLATFSTYQLQLLESELGKPKKEADAEPSSKAAAASEDFGLAINQDTFNRLVADIGGITRDGYTGHVSLKLIRGRLGYQLKLGIPKIDITTANQLEGSIFVDAFAGLYYQVKEVLNCSWRWSKEHRIGVGVKGDPKIKVKTVISSGVSIKATVDLGGIGLQTGLGAAIDKLINLILSPFKKAIELILNGLLHLLTFVVVPVQFAIPEQRTAVRLSRFQTQLYERLGNNDPKNKFLLVKCDLEGVKGS